MATDQVDAAATALAAATVSEPVAVVPATSPEHQAVAALVVRLSGDDRAAAAAELAATVKKSGVAFIKASDLFEQLKAAAEDKVSAAAREGAFLTLKELVKQVGAAAEPFVVAQLPIILKGWADKAAPVREAAEAAGRTLVANMAGEGLASVLPALFVGLEISNNWQTKFGSLTLMADLIKTNGKNILALLPEIVPQLSLVMNDAREQVKTLAYQNMTNACAHIGNIDIDPYMSTLISCIARPQEVQEAVHKLGAVVFVQQVEAPTLCILVPLLSRGLRERVTAIKRKAATIIDNMAKLVDNPADAQVFLPRLLPELEKVSKEASSPELRTVATKAHATLLKVAGDGHLPSAKKAEKEVVLSALNEVLAAKAPAFTSDDVTSVLLNYVAANATMLMNQKSFDEKYWDTTASKPFLAAALPAEFVDAVAAAFYQRCVDDTDRAEKDADPEDEDPAPDLCKCEFSLGYAAKILLSNTVLHLKRGRRYGLCGPNGCGKSTLMRAIANGQVENFPPRDELRTIYVEHDIDGSLSDIPVVEFVFQDPELQDASHPAHGQVEEMLGSVGFTEEMQLAPVSSLSGGWKMKLALARAMLMGADILLLDEPTNHLDVTNVAWLEKYLIGLTNVTSLIVSHDSKFLDHVCTDITHYEGKKLRNYKGNLSKFVERVPEARSYYSLEAATITFKLPEPGFLEGVKTKDRAIVKIDKMGFCYPGTERAILGDVRVNCSLNSRVAVLGPNGAGKSTLIKLLTGELEPTTGVVWKHPNLRIAYVAQHAFHHVEKHLDKTPVEYILWRFAIGEDREALDKASMKTNDEEEAKMKEKVLMEGAKRKVEKLLRRRKLKKDYEYEVQWEGLPIDQTSWLPRGALEEMGFSKMVNAIDIKEAANSGLFQRALTTANVVKHLEDLGLESEFAAHSHIRGLSGGQKVKLVLGAATWLQPHLLVLDEPTNYLDRESLGALATAIKEFGGGVVIISHHSEFTSALCVETWKVGGGVVDAKGGTTAVGREKVEFKVQEEIIDALGNTVKVKAPKKKLSNKEKKARDKLRKARRERGEEVSESEDEDS